MDKKREENEVDFQSQTIGLLCHEFFTDTELLEGSHSIKRFLANLLKTNQHFATYTTEYQERRN